MSPGNRRIVTLGLCLAIAGCATPGTTGSLGATAALPGTATISARALMTSVRIGTSARDDVATTLGTTSSVRFDSGYEVWVYRVPGKSGEKNDPAEYAPGEYVVLFAPSGIVAKTRFRPAPAGSGGAEGR